MSDVTRILKSIEDGDPQAANELLPLVYDELRKLAAVKMAQEKPGQTLQATALVHDAYIRLVDVERAQHWNSRGHFFAAAAEAMRRILVENARRKQTLRQGGHLQRRDMDLDRPVEDVKHEQLLALDTALEQLAAKDQDKADLVKLRYFAGMKIPDAADLLGLSVTTANRYWAYARVWLHDQIARTVNDNETI